MYYCGTPFIFMLCISFWISMLGKTPLTSRNKAETTLPLLVFLWYSLHLHVVYQFLDLYAWKGPFDIEK